MNFVYAFHLSSIPLWLQIVFAVGIALWCCGTYGVYRMGPTPGERRFTRLTGVLILLSLLLAGGSLHL